MEGRRTCRRLILALLIAFGVSTLSAQTYRQISSLDAIDTDGSYLIVAHSDGQSYLLRDSIISTSRKKGAFVVYDSIEETIQAPPAACVWQFITTSSGLYRLYSPDCNKYLGSVNSSDTDLSLTTASNRILSFEIVYADTIFQLLNDDTRGLRFSSLESFLYFGLFKPNTNYLDLHIYKLVTIKDNILALTQTELPDSFALYSGTSTLSGTASALALSDAEDYWLHGTLATDAPALSLSITDEGSLITTAGDTLTTDGTWMQYGSYAVLLLDETYYILATSADGTSVSLVSLDAIDESTQTPLQVTTFAPAAQTTILSLDNTTLSEIPTDDTPVQLSFTGGWSRARLESLDVTSQIVAIDATKAQLPDTLPLIDLSESNCLIYLSDTVAIDADQTAAVLGTTLASDWQLKDLLPFYVPTSFYTDSATISYTRTFSDSGWYTLYLPFEPADTSALNVREIYSAADTLLRLTSTELTAYTPVLCKLAGEAPQTIEFTSAAQTISATSNIDPCQTFTGGTFTGLNTWKTITETNVYALDENGDGSSFARLATGSTLSPFRCYMQITGTMADRLTATAVQSAIYTAPTTTVDYNLLGRPATDRDRIIIRNGKKIITSKP